SSDHLHSLHRSHVVIEASAWPGLTPARAGGNPGFHPGHASGKNIEAKQPRQRGWKRTALQPCLAATQSPFSFRSMARPKMTQTTNRFLDEMARLMNDAAAVAQGVRREIDTLFKTQAERWLHDLDLVRREEFEAVKDMARLAREENEALKK